MIDPSPVVDGPPGGHHATLPHDRVRAHTADAVLSAIDRETDAHLEKALHATPAEIGRRLQRLDREWDTDRAIELEAAVTGLAGLALSRLSPVFLAVPAVVGGAVLMHALKGGYPLLPVFRRLGLRSSREIERERYAMKALRGDFRRLGADTRTRSMASFESLPVDGNGSER